MDVERARKELQKNITKFKNFFKAFRQMHLELERTGKGHRGHGMDHDLMVAQYGILISPNPRTGEMAWIAGLLHSMDRFYSKDKYRKKLTKVMSLLPRNYFTKNELLEILDAIENHGGPNKSGDCLTKVVLQDADRLANLGPQSIIRAGQFFPDIPACELDFLEIKNPKSTYKKPTSVIENIRDMGDWESDPQFGLRLPKAKEIGKKYFDYFREFIKANKSQFKEVGIV